MEHVDEEDERDVIVAEERDCMTATVLGRSTALGGSMSGEGGAGMTIGRARGGGVRGDESETDDEEEHVIVVEAGDVGGMDA